MQLWIFIFPFILSSFPTVGMNFFNKQKTKIITMSFKDVVLKGFSLRNCTTKTKCFVVKALRERGHPSTDGRIKMQCGEQRKRFRLIQNRDNSLRWVVF